MREDRFKKWRRSLLAWSKRLIDAQRPRTIIVVDAPPRNVP
jgi:hypothetical protein